MSVSARRTGFVLLGAVLVFGGVLAPVPPAAAGPELRVTSRAPAVSGQAAAGQRCRTSYRKIVHQLRRAAGPGKRRARTRDIAACRGPWALLRPHCMGDCAYVARFTGRWRFYAGLPMYAAKQDVLPNWLWRKIGAPPTRVVCGPDRVAAVKPADCALVVAPDVFGLQDIRWTSWGRRRASGSAVAWGLERFDFRLFRVRAGAFTRIAHHGIVETITRF